MSISTNQYLHKISQGNAFYNNSGLNGIIFEFVACDVSNTFNVTPTISQATNYGLTDVSAVAVIDIASSLLNNLFYFYSADFSSNTNMFDVGSLLYGINKDFRFDLLFSNAYIQQGTISGTGTQQISDDYVRYIAQTLFNTNNLADIFTNELELVNGVVNMDTPFNNTLNTNITNVTGTGQTRTTESGKHLYLDNSSNSTNNLYVDSCQSLLDGLINIGSTDRGRLFLSDISGQANTNSVDVNNGIYFIPFHQYDLLSLKLTYKFGPTLSGFPYNNAVGDRSYKIVLNCIS
jgi:hypothetical protein